MRKLPTRAADPRFEQECGCRPTAAERTFRRAGRVDSPSAGSPASRDGTVRTVRLHSGLARFRVGASSPSAARSCPTARSPPPRFAASAARGRPKSAARSSSASPRRLVVSAGGSVFALGVTGKQPAADGGGLAPGDRVDCDVRFERGAPETPTGAIRQVGPDGQLVLEGIYLTYGDERLVLVSLTHEDPPPPPSDALSAYGRLASLDGG